MTRRLVAAAAFAALVFVPALARAQEAPPDPEEVKKKILEIEKLMKGAEEALARSTDTRSAEEKTAEAAKKLLDEKAKKETGKSGDELRKEAASGSQQAKDALDRLTKAADEEAKQAAEKMANVLDGSGGGAGGAGGAGQGIKEIIEKIKGDGAGASDGIKWLLKQVRVTQSQSQSSGSPPPQGQEKPKEEKPKEKQPDKPQAPDKKPESKTEPPHSPQFEQWIAELPPQVRKAYETQDWDSIPPKWRDLIRAWADKLSKEDAKENH